MGLFGFCFLSAAGLLVRSGRCACYESSLCLQRSASICCRLLRWRSSHRATDVTGVDAPKVISAHDVSACLLCCCVICIACAVRLLRILCSLAPCRGFVILRSGIGWSRSDSSMSRVCSAQQDSSVQGRLRCSRMCIIFRFKYLTDETRMKTMTF